MMKKIILNLSLILAMQSQLWVAAHATDNYILDSQHSYVLWHAKHFGYSTQVGKFYANGNLTLDDKKPQNSKINVTIAIADISTGIAELDKHLKSKLFFDAEKFPTATFKSSSVDVTGKTTAMVGGMLTLHGVTKPVTLSVVFNQQGKNPITDKPTVGFTATAMIKRSDFGISTLLPGIGDDVKLDIETEAFKTQ
jgi:polyisoprenoid-binding protein YceI